MNVIMLLYFTYIYTIRYLSIDGTQNRNRHIACLTLIITIRFQYTILYFLLLGATVFLYIILALCQWNFIRIFFVNIFVFVMMIIKKVYKNGGNGMDRNKGFYCVVIIL